MLRCNLMISEFLKMCNEIGIPIAEEKTEWASPWVVFLGFLLDGVWMILAIPEEKRIKAINLLTQLSEKKKATVKELQVLCGFLNFLSRAIHPGRVFTRRMYAKFSKVLDIKTFDTESNAVSIGKSFSFKQYYHVKLDNEFRSDCRVWLQFLKEDDRDAVPVINRPMLDLDVSLVANQIRFCSDASAAENLGFGCIYKKRWLFGQWEPNFIRSRKPSIEFLELFALCAGIFTWKESLANCRIVVFCDNQAVVNMINKITSSCKHCMYLLRLLVLNGLKYNRRVWAKYVRSRDNGLSDALSRLQLKRFRKLDPSMAEHPNWIDSQMWPVSKLYDLSSNL